MSTAVTAYVYPKSAGGNVVHRLEAACGEGGTSFHGTGIEPGWAAKVPMADPALSGGPFRAPLLLVADGLGASVDRFVFEREVALAAESFEVRVGRIEAGTVSAQRFRYSAIVDGRKAIITGRHTLRMSRN